MWLVMKLRKWDEIELKSVSIHLPFNFNMVAPTPSSVGFLEVFNDRAEALGEAGSESLLKEVEIAQGVKN